MKKLLTAKRLPLTVGKAIEQELSVEMLTAKRSKVIYMEMAEHYGCTETAIRFHAEKLFKRERCKDRIGFMAKHIMLLKATRDDSHPDA